MSGKRFAKLVKAYGASVSRWPERERELYARQAATREGREMLATERTVDELLRPTDAPPTLSPGFASKVYAIAEAPRQRAFGWERRFLRIAAVSFAACLIGGLLLGAQLGGRFESGGLPADDVSLLVWAATDWQGGVYAAMVAQ